MCHDEDSYKRICEIMFLAFPSMSGEDLGSVIDAIMRVMEREVRKSMLLERRLLVARSMCRSKN